MRLMFTVLAVFCLVISCGKAYSVKEYADVQNAYRRLAEVWEALAVNIAQTGNPAGVLAEVKKTAMVSADIRAGIKPALEDLFSEDIGKQELQSKMSEWESRIGTAKLKAGMEIDAMMKKYPAESAEYHTLVEAKSILFPVYKK